MIAFSLAYLAAAAGLALGVFAIVRPHAAARLVGIRIDESLAHSISEIRATYGGVFAGGHLFALIAGDATVFLALACGWGGAALVRMGSMFVDRAPTPANIGGTIYEITAAVFLAAPALIAPALTT